MATISELVAQHSKVPGDITVRRPITLRSGTFFAWSFKPFFQSIVGLWHGLDDKNFAVTFDNEGTSWQLQEDPKAKVKRAQYMIVPSGAKKRAPYISAGFYLNDEDAGNDFCPSERFCIKRLPETEREFDW